MIAVQSILSGQLISFFPDMESANKFIHDSNNIGKLECIRIHPNITKIEVRYIEYPGPNGYGCNIPEFTTYGSRLRCVINLVKYLQDTCKTFGPDYTEVIDYLIHCKLYINEEYNASLLEQYINKIRQEKPIYV